MKEKTEIIVQIMTEKYQIDISAFDVSFLTKTINSRMNEVSVKEISDYRNYLTQNPSEPELLSKSLINSYSEFFRNPLTFVVLEQMIFPKIMDRKTTGKSGELRIWSAGCASGQEPYSIAILAEDHRRTSKQNIPVRIFATDISPQELLSAGKGIYHLRTIQNTRICHINRYFTNSGEYYSINPAIRELVEFSLFDLLNSTEGAPPSSVYGDFDMIMCSNLLFYYNPDVQKKILTRLSKTLASGGYLITGECETALIKSFRGFTQVNPLIPVFIKM